MVLWGVDVFYVTADIITTLILKSKFPGTWHHTVWYKYSDVLKELTAFFFRTDEERERFPKNFLGRYIVKFGINIPVSWWNLLLFPQNRRSKGKISQNFQRRDIKFGINTPKSWRNLLPLSWGHTKKGEDFLRNTAKFLLKCAAPHARALLNNYYWSALKLVSCCFCNIYIVFFLKFSGFLTLSQNCRSVY
jgi:hypothetical protein